MIDIKSKSRINVHWNVSPYDYNKEKEKSIIAKFSKKYALPKERIKVIPEFLMVDEDGEEISLNSDGIIFCHMEPATILILQILADLLH